MGYAIDTAAASLVAHWITTMSLSHLARPDDDLLGGMWAVVATIFVFRETRSESLPAGLSRLADTCVCFALCLAYLLLFPFTAVGIAVLLALGTLILMAQGRHDDIVTAGITTAVVIVIAALSPRQAWEQPLLRLLDTLIGVLFRRLGSLLSRADARAVTRIVKRST